jgi:hypothetical protein
MKTEEEENTEDLRSANVTVAGIPLMSEEQFKEYFIHATDSGLFSDWLVRPIFEFLPDDDKTHKVYESFKGLKEEAYLMGLEVMSEGWLSPGACGHIFRDMGLILDEASPAKKGDDRRSYGMGMIAVKFDHILNASFYEGEITVNVINKNPKQEL